MSKSSTITDPVAAYNPHPGEILLLDFLEPMGLSQNGVARAIGVPPRRINEIVQGKRSITADTDLRLSRFFGYAPGFFMRLQMDHDLCDASHRMSNTLGNIIPYKAPSQKRAA
jgi:antitoxin HigA-1